MSATIKAIFAADTRQLDQAFNKVTGGADKAQSRFDKVAGGIGRTSRRIVGGIGLVGGAMATVGQNIIDTGAKVTQFNKRAETVFGDNVGLVRDWAAENNKAFGVTKTEMLGLAGAFGDLLIPMGFTREQATGMSTDVVGLAGALAHWSGGQVDSATAADTLAKAMLGERDGLKSLGISISEADVQQRLAANGAAELTGQALEQAKAIATQQLIMEKSTDAQAAWAEGGKQAAEAQNANKVAMEEAKEALMVKLAPALTKGAELMGKLVSAFTALPGPAQAGIAGVVGMAMIADKLGGILNSNTIPAIAKGFRGALDIIHRHPIVFAITAIIGILIALEAKFGVVSGAARWLGGAFSSLVDGARSAFNSLLGAARSAFNGVARAWNSTVGRLSFSVPSWVPGIGGKGFSAPKLPTFHVGGIVGGLPGTDQIIRAQAGERVMSRADSARGAGGPVHVTLEVDGRELARAVAQHSGQRSYVAGG
jgi:hypothetical protein